MGGDLAGGSVHREMELSPGSAHPAVLLGIPLTLAEQFQAGAVQHEMDRASAGDDARMLAGKCPASPAQRRMVGCGQLKPEKAKYAAGEPFRLSQGQIEDKTQRQHKLDRQIGVARLAA